MVHLEKLLTVVIPAYNAQKFLGKCLDSLLRAGQYKEMELLVVDDGSADKTAEIAKSYEQHYKGIVRVLSKENGGHGSAINLGIREAKGKYFRVVDSDDTVNPLAYRAFLKELKGIDSDLVITPFARIHVGNGENGVAGKGRKKQGKFTSVKIRDVEGTKKLPRGKNIAFEEAAKCMFVRMHECTIKTSILQEHNITLSEHCFYVDMQFILYPVPWILTCYILDLTVYRYRIGGKEQSVSIENMQKNRAQHSKVLASLVRFYRERKQAGDSEARLSYLAGGIAKMQAGQVQIALSLPVSGKAKKDLCRAEAWIMKRCPAGYYSNKKISLCILRASRYHLYGVAALIFRIVKNKR